MLSLLKRPPITAFERVEELERAGFILSKDGRYDIVGPYRRYYITALALACRTAPKEAPESDGHSGG